jgi:bleomycin hydrolase
MRWRIFTTAIALSVAVGILLSVPAVAQTRPEKESLPDKHFTIIKEVWRTPSKSQGWTGTCWCFSTTSFLESEAYRLGRGEFNLSEIHTVYYAYLEKASRFIRLHGETAAGQGGLSHDVIYIARKYGLVRKEDYSGFLPGAEEKHNHSEMYTAFKAVIDGIVGNKRGGPSFNWPNAIRGILDAYIGEAPSKINYNGREITPKQFADEVLNLPLNDYVEITSYSYLPFYSKGELLIPDNWLHYDDFYNVPLEDYIRIVDNALENGYSLVFDLDVAAPTFNTDAGQVFVEADKTGGVIDQKQRDDMFDTWATEDHHLEHAVGIAKDEKGATWFLVKDSGGVERGPFEGHEYFSENFVRAKVLFVLLHKDGIPADIKEKLGIK